jgi:outer membrane receptor protein involved in Fe transport
VRQYVITAYVKNVGNVRAINTVAPEVVAGRAALDANVGLPRTIGLTVSASF